MRSLLKYVIVACLSVLASCSNENLRYLGYTYTLHIDDPKIDYSYAHKAKTVDYEPNQVAFGSRPPGFNGTIVFSQGSYGGSVPSRFYVNHANVHWHYLLRDYRYAVFCHEGYVSECDIEDLKECLQEITKKDLHVMMSNMSRENFVYDQFSKTYLPWLSDAIQRSVKTVKCKNIFSDLGGWQMLKPTDGIDIDKDLTRYNVEYKDNGWYDISSPKGHDTVSVMIMYAGKYLNPIVVGLKNKKMKIDIFDANYDTKINKKMLGFKSSDENFMFLEFLCPVLYRNTQDKKLIAEDDFDKFKNKVNSVKLSFVQKFYKSVVQSGNDIRKVQKRYHYSLVQHFMEMIDNQKKEANYDIGMFLPCSYADFVGGNYTITYMGKDWYQVTSSKADSQQVRLKVVLYGKKLTPAIVGIQNPNKNIDYCPERFK